MPSQVNFWAHSTALSRLRYAFEKTLLAGNLREFRNFLMTQFETETHTSMLALTALPQPKVRTNILPGISNSMPTLNDFTNRYVHFVYRHFDENLSRTAEALAISRNTVYRHLATTGTHQDRVTLENGRLYFLSSTSGPRPTFAAAT